MKKTTTVLNWSIKEIDFQLKYNWKISRNESQSKKNFFITASDHNSKGTGEVAPNIRYNESPEKIRSDFAHFLSLSPEKITKLDELNELLQTANMCNALRFGIESAYIHYLANKNNCSIEELLQIPPPVPVSTSYTLPIMDPGLMEAFIKEHHLKRFQFLKLKINQENAGDLMTEVNRCCPDQILRVDANEAWQDADCFLKFMGQYKHLNIEFYEQPFPSSQVEDYIYLKKRSPYEIIGDESITHNPDFKLIKQQFHGINMKLMKAGGYQNGLNILRQAEANGLKTMVGCMIESTLGIFSAINLCSNVNYIDLDGFFVIENEPFNMISEQNGILSISKKY